MKHRSIRLLAALALATPCALLADPVDWTAYQKSFDVTFSGYAGSSTLVDFPVLIRLSKTLNDFDYAKCKVADGGDLRFSDAAGNLLDSEVDTWNPNGESLVWVKVPQLNRDTKITAHYGCASPDAVTPANVWSAGYVGVWHLKESGVPMAESSGVSTPFSTASGSGIVYQAAGAVGGAVDFSGGNSSARLSANDDDDLDGFTDCTFEFWTKQEAASTLQYGSYLLAKRTKIGEDAAYILYSNKDTGKGIFGVSTTGNQPTVIIGSSQDMVPTWGEWCHQAFVRNASGTKKSYGYMNGVSAGTASFTNTDPIYDSTSKLHLGNSQGTGATFNGLIDELRISRVARSADWLLASHDTVAKADFAAFSAARNDWKTYTHKFKVSFANAVPSGTTLTNFPVLVKVSTNGIPGFLYGDCLHENGGDLRFSDENGVLLPSEVDTWNTNGLSLVWVKVPALSSETKLTAYYGCVLPGVVTPSDVWSEGYVGVWHLNESALPLKESSGVSTPFSFSANGTETLGAVGAIGGAVDFTTGDANARLRADDDDDLDGFTDCTFEVWSKQDAEPTRLSGIVAKRQSSSADFAYYIYNNYSTTSQSAHGRNIFIVTTNGSTPSYALGSSYNMVPVWGEWCHQAFVRDVSGTQKAYGYVNGTTKITGGAQSGAIHSSAEPLWLGNSNGGTAAFVGMIDELRISRVARSAAWIKASHDTVTQGDFATYGAAADNVRGTILFFR